MFVAVINDTWIHLECGRIDRLYDAGPGLWKREINRGAQTWTL